MSYVVGSNNSYKPITNMAWIHAQLCKLQKGCTRLAAASDKVYQLLIQGQWFSPGTPASSTTKTGRHDIAEILLKGCSTPKIKSILNFSSVGARKPKGLNRLAKIGYLMSTKGYKKDSKNRLLNVNQRA
jgi:hypothetical protein